MPYEQSYLSPLQKALFGFFILAGIGILISAIAPDAADPVVVDEDVLDASTPGQPPLDQSPETPIVDVPVLAYHIVRPSYPSDDADVRKIAHTPEHFDAEMSHLKSAGYRVISFADLERFFQNGAPLPAKPIILSFDDGWTNQYQYAFPILKKYGYTATFFVFTDAIGAKGFLTWNNLREMLSAGMSIGSHSRTHPFLTKIKSESQLVSEIADSKRILEDMLHIRVDEFAYPFGQYDEHVLNLVKEAGYKSARGDYYFGPEQSPDRLYEISALNAPTTTAEFVRQFP